MNTVGQKMIIVSAPSGAGKTTIVKHLLHTFPQLGFSISATSRKLRPGETNGREYYFVDAEEFKTMIDTGKLLEWQEVYPGSYYGTQVSEIERIATYGQIPVFDVDVVGGCNIKKFYGERALSIFIQPPSIEELKKRLINRGTDTPETIQDRVAKAQYELGFAPKFDKVIINDHLEDAEREALQILKTFLHK